MGAGAGAAAAIDINESSPHGTAIEKAQAELRRDLAVREELRRELEFLEKGGEILDFNFGESPSAHVSSFSLLEPPVDQVLKSGGVTANVVAGGGESDLSQGCVGGRAPDVDGFPVQVPPKTETGSPQSSSRLNRPNLISADPTWTLDNSALKKESECLGGSSLGPKEPAHAKRNRHRSQRIVNGHALPKQLEKVLVAHNSVVELESKTPPVTLENEAMVDMSYQILPQQSSHALASKWNGLIMSQGCEPANEIMVRCGPVLEQHATDPSSREKSLLTSQKLVPSSDFKDVLRGDSLDKERDNSSVVMERGPFELVERSSTLTQVVSAGDEDSLAACKLVVPPLTREIVPAIVSTIQGEGMETSHPGNQSPCTEKRERVISSVDSSILGSDRLQKVEKTLDRPLKADVRVSCINDTRTPDGNVVSNVHVSTDMLGLASRDIGTVRKTVGFRGGSNSRITNVERSAQEEKRVDVHLVKIQFEGGGDIERANKIIADAQLGSLDTNGASNSHELRAEEQARAMVGGIPKVISRLSNASAPSNCKYPGGARHREKEQDPVCQPEAERQRTDAQEKVNKEREDFILAEAEHLKAKRKLIEDRKLLKRTAELSKQMAHWDFVLEEMAWMANDFFQERLWKRAQAAHICRTIAEEKGLDEFRASELCRRQQKLASFCASAVMDFWHIAEAAIMKDKTHNKSWTQERVKADKHDTGAVPMDVDIPVTEEVSEKSLQFEKIEKGNISSIQKYAVRFLKALGFEKIGQAEAPATPERYWESSSSLDPFWEDRFSEESLFYVVPNGSMEAYRISVELETAKREKEVEEEHAAAVAEAEALAAAEAAEDFSNDAGSQEDEQTIFTAEEGRSHISKKKRKKILKTPGAVPKIEGSGLQGFSFRSSAFLNTDGGHPSPIVTGKRSFSGGLGSNLPGSIPVKRARSSAANLRPRATPFSTSPGTIGILQRQGLGSRSPQDDATDILDSSSRGEDTSDTPSSKLHGLGSDGTFITSKSKPKKKKMKSYSGLPGSRSSEGGISAGTPGKGSDGVSQDLLQYEQMKRKGDTHWTPINGADQSLDTPGTPGSQGLPGQQILKKQKLFKADTNSDAVPTSLIPTSQACQIQSKLVKQNSMRDRIRRARPNSKVVPSPGAGIGIPWSASEDQAIVALVNDLGQNWELVSDVLSSSSQIKGIYRKPKQCKERHKSLTERPGSDGQENAEDPTSSQPQSLKQGNGRSSRIQISPEEDTLKHLEHLIQVATKYRMQKSLTVHSESEDQKSLADPHPSHASAMAQFFTGRPPNPLDLCDRVTNNGDVGPHSYPIQLSPGSVLCPPNPALPPGLGMRPPSGGLPPLLPGTNNLHLGQSSVTSSAAINAAAARDAQRFTMNKFSPEETNRLRMATNTLSVFNARRGQQQASATSGLPVLGGLPGPSDLSMLSTNGGGGMLGGLSRNLPLPRAGLPGMGSPLVPTLGPGGLSGMLPPSGSHPQTNMSRKISGLVKVVLGQGCSEEQRLQCLQQLQSLAQHGEPQAAQALSTLSGEMAMMPSPPQPFSPQHQHSLQLQQQQQQQQQHHQQQEQQQQRQQTQNQQHNQQAYIAAEVRMKDQQQQQQQQQQQKQRLPGPLPPTPQLQHMLAPPHQNSVTSLPPRHLASTPHVLSQQPHNSTQKKSVQQPSGGPSQMSQPALASSSLQTSPASPSTSGQPNLPPQQPSLPQQNQPPGQLSQGSGLGKPSQAKQTQKQPQQTSQQPQQQQASRSAKGPGRGSMMMQAHPPQGGLPSTNSGSLSGQPQDESPGQMQSGQRGQSQVGQVQGGKVHSGSQAGISGGSQSQGGQLQGGNQAQSSASVASQQKVLQQQQQTPQGGVSKQQQGSSSQQTVPAVSQQPTAQPIPSQQPTSSAPSTQQSQQLQRRQMSQPQPARRLQTRHLNTTMALPISGQIGKTGMQQTGQGLPSQMAAPPSHNLYQLGGTTALGNPMSMNNPNLHGMTFSSALNSSTVETNSTPWKLNQAIPPLSGGMYNLTRTNSAGSGQVPPLGSSGLHLPSSNGNSSMSALSSPGIHVGSPSMTQGLASMQGASGLHSQKAVNPVLNGRPLPGSQQGIVSGQRSPHMPVPVAMRNMVSSQMRPTVPPSVTGGLPSSTTGGVLQGMPSNGSFQGVPTAGPNHSAPMSSPMPLNGGQLRPPHGGHVPSLSQKPATTAASGSTSSGNTTPSTAGQAPLSSVETTPAASS